MMKTANIKQSAIRTLEIERDGLNHLIKDLTNRMASEFTKAVETIASSSGRSILTGMGKSGHIARKIAATMASTGTPALFVHPAEASHGDLGMIQQSDVVIALSWSGETTELSDIIGYTKRYRVPLIAFTSNATSTLGQQADICLTLPKAQEACPNGLAPTTSTTMQLALGDALSIALLESRGFSSDEFSVFHPGGKLGASLKQVREVMHRGAALPIVNVQDTLEHVIAQIDSKGFGSTVVIDSEGLISGVITDGDLRRNIRRDNFYMLTASDIMNKSPRIISEDTLLAEALESQETNKITTLIVAKDHRPVGIVHYLDLLRSGVV